jgi:hypothetical protein
MKFFHWSKIVRQSIPSAKQKKTTTAKKWKKKKKCSCVMCVGCVFPLSSMIEEQEHTDDSLALVEDEAAAKLVLDSTFHFAFQVGVFFALLTLVLIATWCTFPSRSPAHEGHKTGWKYTPPSMRKLRETFEEERARNRKRHTPQVRKQAFTTSIPHQRRRAARS